MRGKRRAVTQVNIVAKRFEETLKFYRLLGLDIPEPMKQPPGALHAPANVNTGVAFEIDNEFLARLYNASWRTPSGGGRLLLTVSVGAREEVDEAYATLVAAGSQGRQSPYDALQSSLNKSSNSCRSGRAISSLSRAITARPGSTWNVFSCTLNACSRWRKRLQTVSADIRSQQCVGPSSRARSWVSWSHRRSACPSLTRSRCGTTVRATCFQSHIRFQNPWSPSFGASASRSSTTSSMPVRRYAAHLPR